MEKRIIRTLCIILLIFGVVQITNSIDSFYNTEKHYNVYKNSITDISSKQNLQEEFKQEMTGTLRDFTSFLKSYDFFYYGSIAYSIILVVIVFFLFRLRNKARIALLWYSAISFTYIPFTTILREINGAKIVHFYENISNTIKKYSQNDFSPFQNIIDTWYQYRLERFTSAVLIVVFLTLFYASLIWVFSRKNIVDQFQ